MTTKKLKPVWRMNTGNGVPSDLDEMFCYLDKMIERNHHSLFYGCDDTFSINETESDIYAYQTTRVKEAKRCR